MSQEHTNSRVESLHEELMSRVVRCMPFGVSFEMVMEQVVKCFYTGHLKYGTPIGNYKLPPGWAQTDMAFTQAAAMGLFLDYFSNED